MAKYYDSGFQKLDRIIDGLYKAFNDRLGGTNTRVYRKIIEELTQFAQRNGVFIKQNLFGSDNDATNARMQIKRLINKAITESGYQDVVYEYLRDLNQLDPAIADIHANINDIEIDYAQLATGKKALIEQISDKMLGRTKTTLYDNRIQQILAHSITRGQSIAQTEELLKEFVIKSAVYPRYAAFNGIMQYDGGINQLIADEYELDGVQYVGSIVKHSRPQCRDWVALNIFPKADLQRLIDGAYSNGKGMIVGTTPQNFFLFRGGHNCRHKAFPVRLTT